MSEKKKSTFWKDFKAFITRGNVVDLAVAVVIGGSFGKIVTGFVNYIINPFIGIFLKEGNLDSFKTVITAATAETEEVAILWGTWIQTIIDFLITAFCIFCVLRVLMHAKNTLEAKKIAEAKAKEEADKAKAEQEKKSADEAAAIAAKKQEEIYQSTVNTEKLLIEIRDLLNNRK